MHERDKLNFLLIADYCITGTFSTRIIHVSYAYFF